MSRSLRTRLSVMMFVQYSSMGAILPMLSHYLQNYLEFEKLQAGQILGMSPLALLIAPFLYGHYLERLVGPERALGICHIVSGLLMYWLTTVTTFPSFLIGYFLYGIAFTPSIGLTNTVAFHHIDDGKRNFTKVRLWGTVGWVVVAWVFSYAWLGGNEAIAHERLPDALRLSAILSLSLGLYAFSLPKSHAHRAADNAHPWKAFRVFAKPGLAALCIFALVGSTLHHYYYYGMSPFLSQLGLADRSILPAMSLGQLSEIFMLGILGMVMAKFGVKRTMLFGLLMQTFRYSIFAIGFLPLVIAAIPSHGPCYAFYFSTAYIYLDTHTPPSLRGSAQQMFTILISGFGPYLGSVIGGWVAERCLENGGEVNYTLYWLTPAVAGLLVAALFAKCFHTTPPIKEA